MVERILVGLIFVVIGYFLTAKSDWLLDNFGRIAWFEQHLGTEGGTRLFYKLLGVATILGGFSYAIGLLQAGINRLFGPLFGAF